MKGLKAASTDGNFLNVKWCPCWDTFYLLRPSLVKAIPSTFLPLVMKFFLPGPHALVRNGITFQGTIQLAVLGLPFQFIKLTKVAKYNLQPIGIIHSLFFSQISTHWCLLFFFQCYCFLQISVLFLSCKKIFISIRCKELFEWTFSQKNVDFHLKYSILRVFFHKKCRKTIFRRSRRNSCSRTLAE